MNFALDLIYAITTAAMLAAFGLSYRKLCDLELKPLNAALIPGILIVILTPSLGYLGNAALQIKQVRQIFDPRSRVEGSWFEMIDPPSSSRYSIIRIHYTSEGYTLSGNSFDASVQRTRSFKGQRGAVVFIDDTRALYYYDVTMPGRPPTEGLGRIVFDFGGQVPTANGYFQDHSGELSPRAFQLSRITEEKMKQLGWLDGTVEADRKFIQNKIRSEQGNGAAPAKRTVITEPEGEAPKP